ncbi:MAG: hypothetical protein ACNS63_00790 [Candidatus Nitrospinota bacterium M3_3B_026]
MSENKLVKRENAQFDRNLWQIVVRVPDTRRVVHIARQADRGIRSLRNGLLVHYPAEEVIPLLEDFERATQNLNEAAEKICERAGMPYKAPKGLKTG